LSAQSSAKALLLLLLRGAVAMDVSSLSAAAAARGTAATKMLSREARSNEATNTNAAARKAFRAHRW